MSTVFVQFNDVSKTAVVSVFACAQDPEVYPNFEEIGDDDARYLAFVKQARGDGIPAQVTKRQGRLALLAAGKLTAVTDAIAALPSPQREEAGIEWNDATNYERSSPFVAMLAEQVGLDDAALDALFTAAATL
jgi:protein-disulfide isomerase-like protein with CxxC motif